MSQRSCQDNFPDAGSKITMFCVHVFEKKVLYPYICLGVYHTTIYYVPLQVALKWLLQKDAVTSVVMGCKTISQLEDNMGAGDRTWELSSHDMEILDTASQYDVPYPYNIINKLNNRSKTWKF